MKRTPLKRKTRLRQISKSDNKRKRARRIACVMKLFRGRPCAICGTRNGTVGHHIESRQRRPDLADNASNIVPLCPEHHLYSNVMSAHGCYEARARFGTWLASYLLGSN